MKLNCDVRSTRRIIVRRYRGVVPNYVVDDVSLAFRVYRYLHFYFSHVQTLLYAKSL